MAKREILAVMPVSALVFGLALGLAAMSLASCGSVDYNAMKTDFTYPGAADDNSANLIFADDYDRSVSDNVIATGYGARLGDGSNRMGVVVESFGGKRVNWRSKPAQGIGAPITKAVIPAGRHSYVITTTAGRGRLEGEMEFISGHTYQIQCHWRGDWMNHPEEAVLEITIEDITAEE